MDRDIKLIMVKYWFRKYEWSEVLPDVIKLMTGLGYTLNELKEIYDYCQAEKQSISKHGFINQAEVDYLIKEWKMAKKRKRR